MFNATDHMDAEANIQYSSIQSLLSKYYLLCHKLFMIEMNNRQPRSRIMSKKHANKRNVMADLSEPGRNDKSRLEELLFQLKPAKGARKEQFRRSRDEFDDASRWPSSSRRSKLSFEFHWMTNELRDLLLKKKDPFDKEGIRFRKRSVDSQVPSSNGKSAREHCITITALNVFSHKMSPILINYSTP